VGFTPSVFFQKEYICNDFFLIKSKFIKKMSVSELDNHDEIEGFNDLSTEQQKDLLEAIAETYDESNLIPHEEVISRLNKWIITTPIDVQTRILKSYEESFNPENWIDHNKVKKQHAKWLKE
jgi:hypothetical protein